MAPICSAILCMVMLLIQVWYAYNAYKLQQTVSKFRYSDKDTYIESRQTSLASLAFL
jgi:hypothetical protein